MTRPGALILAAGFAFYLVAFALVCFTPLMLDQGMRAAPTVRDAQGRVVPVRPYTVLEIQGRAVYIREVCFHCHSQFVRPVTGEEERYGPVSQPGESAYDRPHLFGTRRIGPDLAREGGLRSDDWHYQHLYQPRSLVPASVMPAHPWLFQGLNATGAPIPTEDARALVAYLQRLGADLGDWRSAAGAGGAGGSSPLVTPALLAKGKAVYDANCAACHGAAGLGDGPAAAALRPRPRNFVAEELKYGGDDASLFRTVAAGVPKTAMPAWRATLSDEEIWAVIAYLREFREGDDQR